ncbi:conserved hypothetical protein [Candidatus Magnetomoraceae bacterium gMMP-15]
MNLLTRSNIENVLIQFEAGKISRQQAILDLLEMPQVSDFEGIWELLIIHVYLIKITVKFPQLLYLIPHWKKEVNAWQQRLKRFLQKPKPSFRNAINNDFKDAKKRLLKNDMAKLVLNLEMHLEDIINLDEVSISELLIHFNLENKEIDWFLSF